MDEQVLRQTMFALFALPAYSKYGFSACEKNTFTISESILQYAVQLKIVYNGEKEINDDNNNNNNSNNNNILDFLLTINSVNIIRVSLSLHDESLPEGTTLEMLVNLIVPRFLCEKTVNRFTCHGFKLQNETISTIVGFDYKHDTFLNYDTFRYD